MAASCAITNAALSIELFMKKLIGFTSLFLVLVSLAVACGPQEAKKEVIVVPVQTRTVSEPPKKSTTVTVDKNGVKVESKKDN